MNDLPIEYKPCELTDDGCPCGMTPEQCERLEQAASDLASAQPSDAVLRKAQAFVDSCPSAAQALKAIAAVLDGYDDREGALMLSAFVASFAAHEATTI